MHWRQGTPCPPCGCWPKSCFVAPQNQELLREARLRKVEDALSLAVEEARKGGLSLEELQEMLNLLYKGDNL